MKHSYTTAESNSTPNILEVVGRYTSLRKVGREESGLCPLHADKNPSLRINPTKGVWYCHACAIGGDSIRFVELVEGVDFKTALSLLGMGDNPHPPRKLIKERQLTAAWVRGQIQKMNSRIRDLDEMIELAEEVGDTQLAESLWNERRILADLRDDLGRPEYFVELKDLVTKIVRSFE